MEAWKRRVSGSCQAKNIHIAIWPLVCFKTVTLHQGLSNKQEEGSPLAENDKIHCGLLGPYLCNKNIDPER